MGHAVITFYYYTLLNVYFSLFFQEEEIPELEIDIDELLELPDEGQRTKLQVSLYTKQLHSSVHLSQFTGFTYFMKLVHKNTVLQTKDNLNPRSATFRAKNL